jgi:hypothetical protein
MNPEIATSTTILAIVRLCTAYTILSIGIFAFELYGPSNRFLTAFAIRLNCRRLDRAAVQALLKPAYMIKSLFYDI